MSSFWTVWVFRFVPSFFVIAVCIGIFSYPGGNIHNPEQIGYSFTHNFLSDLGGYRSHSGEVNFISSFFFNAGMFFLPRSALVFCMCRLYLKKIGPITVWPCLALYSFCLVRPFFLE